MRFQDMSHKTLTISEGSVTGETNPTIHSNLFFVPMSFPT